MHDLFEADKDFYNGARVRARHILLTPPANDPKAAAAAIDQLKAMKTQIETKVNAAPAALPANTDNLERERGAAPRWKRVRQTGRGQIGLPVESGGR